MRAQRLVFFGLSITSSWGNGHASTYRALLRALAARGHDVTFIERDVPWYAENRDLPDPPYCRTLFYETIEECRDRFSKIVREADVVIVGSYVPDGVLLGTWVTNLATGVKVFYDIDTPVTLAKLARGEDDYLSPAMIPRFDLYLSFSGGSILQALERRYGAQRAQALYCSVDPEIHFPEAMPNHFDLGYLGTYSEDRQPAVDSLFCDSARKWAEGRFLVAGPQYPRTVAWPANVKRIKHLPPPQHRRFYNAQRFTLNVTRPDMIRAGFSPSVRLFEAAACGTAIISDSWPGIETILQPGSEILIASKPTQVVKYLREMPEDERLAIGVRARKRILEAHTSAHRAMEFETYVEQAAEAKSTAPVTLTA